MMPSPTEMKYPEGPDCSRCTKCTRIELGKVHCIEYGDIEPDSMELPLTWSLDAKFCPNYLERAEFMEARE
jgi:hypothetical protein